MQCSCAASSPPGSQTSAQPWKPAGWEKSTWPICVRCSSRTCAPTPPRLPCRSACIQESTSRPRPGSGSVPARPFPASRFSLRPARPTPGRAAERLAALPVSALDTARAHRESRTPGRQRPAAPRGDSPLAAPLSSAGPGRADGAPPLGVAVAAGTARRHHLRGERAGWRRRGSSRTRSAAGTAARSRAREPQPGGAEVRGPWEARSQGRGPCGTVADVRAMKTFRTAAPRQEKGKPGSGEGAGCRSPRRVWRKPALLPTSKAAADEKWKPGSKSSFLLLTSPENFVGDLHGSSASSGLLCEQGPAAGPAIANLDKVQRAACIVPCRKVRASAGTQAALYASIFTVIWVYVWHFQRVREPKGTLSAAEYLSCLRRALRGIRDAPEAGRGVDFPPPPHTHTSPPKELLNGLKMSSSW